MRSAGLRPGETRGKRISILSLVRMVNVVNCFALMAFAFTKSHLSFGELGEREGDKRNHLAVRHGT